MAFERRQLVVLLLLLLFLAVVSATAAPIPRSLKLVKNQALSNSHYQDIKKIDKDDEMLERRMNMEVSDYPGTGANPTHDPSPPGRL